MSFFKKFYKRFRNVLHIVVSHALVATLIKLNDNQEINLKNNGGLSYLIKVMFILEKLKTTGKQEEKIIAHNAPTQR